MCSKSTYLVKFKMGLKKIANNALALKVKDADF